MSPPKADDSLTTSQVAEELGVTAGTVRRYISDKILPEPGWTYRGRRKQRAYSPSWVEDAKRALRGGFDA
jgi:DNA-binding transcriptional MerR regulator